MRKYVLAGLLGLVTAGWLAASITLTGAGSTIVAPPAVRQGTYISPDVVLPASGIATAMIAFDVPVADYENPVNRFDFSADMSADGLTNWRSVASFGWVSPGHPVTDPKTGVIDPTNSVTFDVRPWLAQGLTHLRASVTVPNAMTAGVTVTLQ